MDTASAATERRTTLPGKTHPCRLSAPARGYWKGDGSTHPQGASDAARTHHHNHLGTEHLLTGIHAAGGPTGATLTSWGITSPHIDSALDEIPAYPNTDSECAGPPLRFRSRPGNQAVGLDRGGGRERSRLAAGDRVPAQADLESTGRAGRARRRQSGNRVPGCLQLSERCHSLPSAVGTCTATVRPSATECARSGRRPPDSWPARINPFPGPLHQLGIVEYDCTGGAVRASYGSVPDLEDVTATAAPEVTAAIDAPGHSRVG